MSKYYLTLTPCGSIPVNLEEAIQNKKLYGFPYIKNRQTHPHFNLKENGV